MAYEMLLNERDVALDIVARRPALRIRRDEAVYAVAEQPAPHGAFALTIDNRVFTGYRAIVGDEVYVRIGARTFIVGLPQAQLRAHAHSAADDEIRADMPGTVIAHHAEAGQAVKAGDRLITIESMKLQVSLVAPRDAVIEKYHVAGETAFERGALLVSFLAETLPEAPKASE
jgi:acetyl/propionyl-CoA carboxylase alpha subunit